MSNGVNLLLAAVGLALAALAIGWAILRIRTGIKVRAHSRAGDLDTRDLGVGARYYAPILMLATVVGFLSWFSVRASGPLQWLIVLSILLCAVVIGRLRMAGFRSRQDLMTEVRR